MEQSWTKNIAETFQYFDVKESVGLSTGQVKDAQDKYGPNGKLCNCKLTGEVSVTQRSIF